MVYHRVYLKFSKAFYCESCFLCIMTLDTLKRLLVVTGTPGAGKSTIAQLLVSEFGFVHIDFHELIEKDPTLSSDFNKEKDCYDLDMDRVEELVRAQLLENPGKLMVLDTHVSQHLTAEIIFAAIIVRCSDLKVLEERLADRGYAAAKVKENLDAEIFDICHDETIELGVETLVFDSAQGLNEGMVIEKVTELLARNGLF